MNRPYINSAALLYAVAMAAVIVGVDFLFFFKHRFWERLAANVGIVALFAALYFLVFHRRP